MVTREECLNDIDDYPVKSNVGHRKFFTPHDQSHAVRILGVLDGDVPDENDDDHNKDVPENYNENHGEEPECDIVKLAGWHVTLRPIVC